MTSKTNEIDDPCSWTDGELFAHLQAVDKIKPDESLDDYLRLELLELVKEDLGII